MVPENKGRRRNKRVVSTIVRVLALVALAGTGAIGIYNGIIERSLTETPLQTAVNYGVLAYGVLGLVSAFGLMRRAWWSFWSAVAWAVIATLVAGTAVLAYGGTDVTLRSAAPAYVAAALFTAAIVWATRTVIRARNSPSEDD